MPGGEGTGAAPAGPAISLLPSYLAEPAAVAAPPAPVGQRGRRRRPEPSRRGAAPGPQSAPYRASSAQPTEITFRRAVDVPFAVSVEALAAWWRAAADDGGLDVGRSRLFAPCPGGEERWARVAARIGRGRVWPGVRAELELFPWLGSFGTQLTLCPRRTVYPGRRYFRGGHALLDAIVAVLQHHAGAGGP